MLVRIRLMLAAFTLVLLSGCALFAPKAPGVDRPYTGFMQNYRPLNTVEVEEREFVASKAWIAPSVNLSAYRTAIVEPIRIEHGINRDRQVTNKALKDIRRYMAQAMSNKLQEYYRVSDQPYGKTLKARVAITGVETKDEALRFYEFLPAGLAITGIAKAIGVRDEEIYIFVEAEFVDADTDEVVAKTLVGMVGQERLENKWEEITLAKVQSSIDQWINQQVVALKEAKTHNLIVSNTTNADSERNID
ncbi:DUF3313 domain-containing protein [Litoribrevibacter albus]|uniref:DUF3313 domain-containing protein n=1 Tax=Litoribrevibacter albus TaxID=1473156 RepID=A0AA37SEM3_9GAMM|nr:DUF3313 domain-containing protein [Litoribrevibacter albus]GLQ33096.1 hypothetical protein GCM10007876_35750 [Litoribrevibacter albus]